LHFQAASWPRVAWLMLAEYPVSPRFSRTLVVALIGALAVLRSDAGATDDVACRNVAILASPATPTPGTALRIVVAGDEGSPDDVVVQDPSGAVVQGGRVSHPGSPWSVVTTVENHRAGTYRVIQRRDDNKETQTRRHDP